MNRRISIFQNLVNFTFTPKRTCSELPEGIQYYGFVYYPRHKDFKDPPYEPSKLFLVRRIKSMSGRNPTERKALGWLNIDGHVRDRGHISVVKNIPEINAILWKVKHLVDIKPIKIRGELPKDGDFSGTYLRDTGELVISSKLKCKPNEIENSEKHIKREVQLRRPYLKEYYRLQWLQGYNTTE